LVIASAGLDRLVGDPRWCPHPVVVMGWWIDKLRRLVEAGAGDRPWALRLGGGLICAALVGGSGLAGWSLERLAVRDGAGLVLLALALASALAGRSLEQAVEAVLRALPAEEAADLDAARRRLAWFVPASCGPWRKRPAKTPSTVCSPPSSGCWWVQHSGALAAWQGPGR
jgi:adenosylcobinamide-phosphate synthase